MDASKEIDKQISDLSDWRGAILSQVRKIVHEVDPEIIEEWKWETAVFFHNGMVCAFGAFKDHVKINFFKGARLKDAGKLFNSGLEAKNSRTIDFYAGDKINEPKLKILISEAVALNKK